MINKTCSPLDRLLTRPNYPQPVVKIKKKKRKRERFIADVATSEHAASGARQECKKKKKKNQRVAEWLAAQRMRRIEPIFSLMLIEFPLMRIGTSLTRRSSPDAAGRIQRRTTIVEGSQKERVREKEIEKIEKKEKKKPHAKWKAVSSPFVRSHASY